MVKVLSMCFAAALPGDHEHPALGLTAEGVDATVIRLVMLPAIPVLLGDRCRRAR